MAAANPCTKKSIKMFFFAHNIIEPFSYFTGLTLGSGENDDVQYLSCRHSSNPVCTGKFVASISRRVVCLSSASSAMNADLHSSNTAKRRSIEIGCDLSQLNWHGRQSYIYSFDGTQKSCVVGGGQPKNLTSRMVVLGLRSNIPNFHTEGGRRSVCHGFDLVMYGKKEIMGEVWIDCMGYSRHR